MTETERREEFFEAFNEHFNEALLNMVAHILKAKGGQDAFIRSLILIEPSLIEPVDYKKANWKSLSAHSLLYCLTSNFRTRLHDGSIGITKSITLCPTCRQPKPNSNQWIAKN